MCLLASFTLANSLTGVFAQTPQLVPLTTFGTHGDGSIRPGDFPFITGDGTTQSQRGMAYNPLTGHLLIAHRAGQSIHAIDGATGAEVGTMPFTVMVDAGNTGFRLSKIGVADDGAVYVANLTSASTALIGFVLYRYASETNEQTFVFAGDPSNGAATSAQANGRWGDTMVVRGAGINTEILIASQGTLAAILRPTDETMTAFTATTLTTDASSGSMASGISFGTGNTFWTKANGFALRRLNYDLGLGTATTDLTYVSTEFPTRISPILHIPSSNLLVGVEIVSGFDFVKLYDVANVSSVNPPVFLDSESYTTNLANNSAGQICHSEGRVWALNTEHGIRAFTLQVTNEPVLPSFFVQPVGGTVVAGTNFTFTARADGVPSEISYQWFYNVTNLLDGETNTSLVLTNLEIADSGQFSVVGSNSAGATTSSIVTLSVVPDSIFYVYEPFDYAPGQLTGVTAPSGQIWITSGSGDHSQIAPGSLSVPAALPASSGNSVTNGGIGRASRLTLGTSQSIGTIYASLALRINSFGATYTGNGLLASFANTNSSGGTEQQARIMTLKNGAGYNIGVGRVASYVWDTNIFMEGETVFVVVGYTFVPGVDNDVASIWINPDPSTFGNAEAPAPTLIGPVLTTDDLPLINAWSFRQSTDANTPANIQYDELRIANKWSLVTPLPGANITLSLAKSGNSIVLSWPTAGSEGFILESATALANPTAWDEVTESIVVQGANNTVTLGISSNPTFYRLRK